MSNETQKIPRNKSNKNSQMSFADYRSLVAENDLVLAYQSPENISSFRISRNGVYNCKFGSFKHADIIGRPFGSKIFSNDKNKGFVFILYPTPELWTLVLPHRTQILYHADIAFISLQLDLGAGSTVVEAGTGSGSFSHSLARTVAPTGHLYTFEYHEPRSQQARLEFTEHGLGNVVTVTHRDVCQNGFGLENIADAVFLDLPSPWEAISQAKLVLKKTKPTRICTFSPCIEQVQRNCDALRTQGFIDVRTFETLQRSHDLKHSSPPTLEEFMATDSITTKRKSTRDHGTSRPKDSQFHTKPNKEMRGHTSYLTFATLQPSLTTTTATTASTPTEQQTETS